MLEFFFNVKLTLLRHQNAQFRKKSCPSSGHSGTLSSLRSLATPSFQLYLGRLIMSCRLPQILSSVSSTISHSFHVPQPAKSDEFYFPGSLAQTLALRFLFNTWNIFAPTTKTVRYLRRFYDVRTILLVFKKFRRFKI